MEVGNAHGLSSDWAYCVTSEVYNADVRLISRPYTVCGRSCRLFDTDGRSSAAGCQFTQLLLIDNLSATSGTTFDIADAFSSFETELCRHLLLVTASHLAVAAAATKRNHRYVDCFLYLPCQLKLCDLSPSHISEE